MSTLQIDGIAAYMLGQSKVDKTDMFADALCDQFELNFI